MNSRIRFTESWLPENPQGIEPTKTFGSIKFNIKDLLNAGVTPLKTIDPSVFKIDLSDTVYYWMENPKGEIILGVELLKAQDNLTVSLSGKSDDLIGKAPYADQLYQTILQDSSKPLLFSDIKLSNDGKKIWKRLVNSGRTVTVYDRKAPGQSRQTITTPDELEQFWKMDDPSYQRWQYVLSESGSMTHNIMAMFNTRRARELTSLGVDQEYF